MSRRRVAEWSAGMRRPQRFGRSCQRRLQFHELRMLQAQGLKFVCFSVRTPYSSFEHLPIPLRLRVRCVFVSRPEPTALPRRALPVNFRRSANRLLTEPVKQNGEANNCNNENCRRIVVSFCVGIRQCCSPCARNRACISAKNGTESICRYERVKVAENTFRPGAESPSIPRPFRVVRVIKGGANFNVSTPMTEKRTAQYKTGEVNALEAGPVYILKNAGDTELVLYIVYINR
jgi:hypothetical protein